jgi:aminocarboxymuconate-semialdehyde decarboxylase
MRIIDVHNHFYPAEYIEAVRRGPSAITVTTDEHGNPVFHSPGDKNYLVPGHRDLAYRRRVLDEAGVAVQVISLTAPGTLIEAPERSVPLARVVNDAFARIRDGDGDRFLPLGTLPLNDPDGAVEELERAVGLGFKGFLVFGNVNGVPLADRRFWPLYQRASDRGLVFYIHPTYPLGVEAMTEYWLMPLVGFLFDTTLAAAHLVFAGVPERFPGITWVLGHLGGAIPYLAERLDRGYRAFPECRAAIPKPPSEYLKRFYYDTVNFDPRALRLAVEFAGADQILAGSDYPHLIGSIERMKQSLGALDLSESDREKIMGGNAARLFGI